MRHPRLPDLATTSSAAWQSLVRGFAFAPVMGDQTQTATEHAGRQIVAQSFAKAQCFLSIPLRFSIGALDLCDIRELLQAVRDLRSIARLARACEATLEQEARLFG